MNSTTVFIFKRTATSTPPTIPAVSLNYVFSTGLLSGSLNSWEQSLPVAGGAYRWVTSAIVSSETDSATVLTNAWKGVTLLAADGTVSFTATIYKQVAGNPGSPVATASTYDFTTGELTPPAGWSVTQPNVTTTNTWACEYTFVGLANTVVTGIGNWGPVNVISVAGIDGQNTHVVTIYKQGVDGSVTTPSGGSYKFSGDICVTPLGWSRTMPTVSNIPTFASYHRFSSNDPLQVISGTSWSSPVVVARIGYDYISRYNSIVFKYAGSKPATPNEGDYEHPIPTGWSDGIPTAVVGQELWTTSRLFYADNMVVTTWAEPVQVSNNYSLTNKLQFSTDGSSWHEAVEATAADHYMRAGVNDGTGWSYSAAVLIKGEQGIQGDEGLPAAPTYTWIAYAYDLGGINGFTVGSPSSDHKCIGLAHNQVSSNPSNDPSKYVWSMWVGADGAPGANGVTTFTWRAYCNFTNDIIFIDDVFNAAGVTDFTTGNWTNERYLGLAVNKYTSVESEDPSEYSWSLIANAPPVDVPTPPAITGLTATGGAHTIALQWTAPTYEYIDTIQIYRGLSTNMNAAEVVGTTKTNMYNDTPPAHEYAVTYYYWVRIVGDNNGVPILGIMNAPAYVSASTRNDVTYITSLLTGQLSGSQLTDELNSKIIGPSATDTAMQYQWGQTLMETNANITIVHDMISANINGVSAVLDVSKQVNAIAPPLWAAGVPVANNACVLYDDGSGVKLYRNKTGGVLTDVTWIIGHWTLQGTGRVDLYSEWTVKGDNNGNIFGIGLAGDNNTSSFIANVQTFAVQAPTAYKGAGPVPTARDIGHVLALGDRWARYDGAGTRPSIWEWNGSAWIDRGEHPVPFSVLTTGTTIDGVPVPAGVYIDGASIREVSATNVVTEGLSVERLVATQQSIFSSMIEDAEFNMAYIGTTIQSGTGSGIDFAPTIAATGKGWEINKDGTFKFQHDANNAFTYNGTEFAFKGKVTFTSGSSGLLSNIDPTAASTLSTAASDASSAVGRTSNWVKPGQTTIDGNKIYTGDAYVDTLQIKGNAVIVPEYVWAASASSVYIDITIPAGENYPLLFQCIANVATSGPWHLHLLRNGVELTDATVLAYAGMYPFSYKDSPGAGTWRYTFQNDCPTTRFISMIIQTCKR